MQQPDLPDVMDPRKVGTFAAVAKSGGGYVWDEVLEYRVWCHPENGAEDLEQGNDYFFAFARFEDAKAFSDQTEGAKMPLALVLQREFIDEPEPGHYIHVKAERVTEWPVAFLKRPRRTDATLADFFAPDAPPNRLAILRGEAQTD